MGSVLNTRRIKAILCYSVNPLETTSVAEVIDSDNSFGQRHGLGLRGMPESKAVVW